MRSMGVKPLAGGRGAARPAGRPGPRDAEKASPPAPRPGPSAGTAATSARPAASPPARGGSDQRSLLAEIDRLRGQLEQLRPLVDRVAELEQRNRDQAAGLQELAAAEALAQAERDEARQQAHSMGEALARATAQGGTGPEPLERLLQARGLIGSTEQDRLWQALAEARQASDLVALLGSLQPEAVSTFLAERVLLLGGCEACAGERGGIVIEVPRPRCDLCHGEDLRLAVRRFYDALLVNGLTRVLMVGGSPRQVSLLRSLLRDRRVELRQVHGGLRRDSEQVAADLAWARLLVVWESPALDGQVSAAHLGFTGRQVRLSAPDPAAFLLGIARGLA